MSNADFQQIVCPPFDIKGSAGRQMEGFLDVAHFAWVHMKPFGDRNNPFVPSYQVEVTDYGLHVEYLSTVGNYPKGLQHLNPENFTYHARPHIYCLSQAPKTNGSISAKKLNSLPYPKY